MRSASIDICNLFRSSLWRAVKYSAYFAFIMLAAMAIKSALDWRSHAEWSILPAAVWIGFLLAGPVEALSQRSVRNAKRMTRQTTVAAAFAALWAAGVSAFVAVLAFRMNLDFVYLVAGSAVLGAVLATAPPTTGGVIQ